MFSTSFCAFSSSSSQSHKYDRLKKILKYIQPIGTKEIFCQNIYVSAYNYTQGEPHFCAEKYIRTLQTVTFILFKKIVIKIINQ